MATSLFRRMLLVGFFFDVIYNFYRGIRWNERRDTSTSTASSTTHFRLSVPPPTPPPALLLNYETLFPPYLFRTKENKTNFVRNEEALRQGCQQLNPKYEEIIYDNKDMKLFVHKYYPEFSDTYDNDHHFFHAVMHADVWRYLVLHHYGGVYFDMDIECRKPIDRWGETLGIVRKRNRNRNKQQTTTEAENSSKYWHHWHWHDTPIPFDSDSDSDGERNDHTNNENQNTDPRLRIQGMVGIEFLPYSNDAKYGQFVQFAIASRPNNTIFYRAAELAVEAAAVAAAAVSLSSLSKAAATARTEEDVLQITGPTQFTEAVFEYLIDNGYLTTAEIRQPPHSNNINNSSSFWHNRDRNSLVGDVAILNKQAFGFHQFHDDSPRPNSNELFLRHWYHGSWRGDGFASGMVKQEEEAEEEEENEEK